MTDRATPTSTFRWRVTDHILEYIRVLHVEPFWMISSHIPKGTYNSSSTYSDMLKQRKRSLSPSCLKNKATRIVGIDRAV